MKTCTRCGLEAPLEYFPPHSLCKDGRNTQCRSCVLIRHRKWRDKNREKRKQRDREVRALKKDPNAGYAPIGTKNKKTPPCTHQINGDVLEMTLPCGAVVLMDPADVELCETSWHLNGGGYACRSSHVGGKTAVVLMHRVILGAQPGQHVDHINGDRSDNRRCNLRFATQRENVRNSGVRSDNRSGYKGITKNGVSWRARINVNGQNIWLGSHPSPEAAALAYDEAARKYFGEFARTNFPLTQCPPSIAV